MRPSRALAMLLGVASGVLAFAAMTAEPPSEAFADSGDTGTPAPTVAPAPGWIAARADIEALLKAAASGGSVRFERNGAAGSSLSFTYGPETLDAGSLQIVLHLEEVSGAPAEGTCIEDRTLTLVYDDLKAARIDLLPADSVLNDFVRYRGRTGAGDASDYVSVSATMADGGTQTSVRTSAIVNDDKKQFPCPSLSPVPIAGVTFLLRADGGASDPTGRRLACLLQRMKFCTTAPADCASSNGGCP
jgi:hypothetical protein